MTVTKQILVVGGLPVHVHTSSRSDNTKPVAILFFLHGRNGEVGKLENYISDIYSQVLDQEHDLKHELVIVSFVSLQRVCARFLSKHLFRTTVITDTDSWMPRQTWDGVEMKPNAI
jgi:hypothetical protein